MIKLHYTCIIHILRVVPLIGMERNIVLMNSTTSNNYPDISQKVLNEKVCLDLIQNHSNYYKTINAYWKISAKDFLKLYSFPYFITIDYLAEAYIDRQEHNIVESSWISENKMLTHQFNLNSLLTPLYYWVNRQYDQVLLYCNSLQKRQLLTILYNYDKLQIDSSVDFNKVKFNETVVSVLMKSLLSEPFWIPKVRQSCLVFCFTFKKGERRMLLEKFLKLQLQHRYLKQYKDMIRESIFNILNTVDDVYKINIYDGYLDLSSLDLDSPTLYRIQYKAYKFPELIKNWDGTKTIYLEHYISRADFEDTFEYRSSGSYSEIDFQGSYAKRYYDDYNKIYYEPITTLNISSNQNLTFKCIIDLLLAFPMLKKIIVSPAMIANSQSIIEAQSFSSFYHHLTVDRKVTRYNIKGRTYSLESAKPLKIELSNEDHQANKILRYMYFKAYALLIIHIIKKWSSYIPENVLLLMPPIFLIFYLAKIFMEIDFEEKIS